MTKPQTAKATAKESKRGNDPSHRIQDPASLKRARLITRRWISEVPS